VKRPGLGGFLFFGGRFSGNGRPRFGFFPFAGETDAEFYTFYKDALGKDNKNIDVKMYDINISRALPFMLKEYEAVQNAK
jgi:hypothetical protein